VSITFTEELRGEALRAFFVAMVPRAEFLGFVWEGSELSPRAGALIEHLAPYLVEEGGVKEWPGVQLPDDWDDALDGPVKRWLYRYGEEVAVLVSQESSRLYEWVNPHLPQDLHLLDGQRRPVFGSITTEDDAWVECSVEEWEQVLRIAPELRAVAVTEAP
jgi:hypothetical protein